MNFKIIAYFVYATLNIHNMHFIYIYSIYVYDKNNIFVIQKL